MIIQLLIEKNIYFNFLVKIIGFLDNFIAVFIALHCPIPFSKLVK